LPILEDEVMTPICTAKTLGVGKKQGDSVCDEVEGEERNGSNVCA
jgi:hypothetical protein